MLEKLSQAAERAAMNVSRRKFLGKLGQGALALAGVVGGMLALPGDAQAGGALCCCYGRCFKRRGGCPSPCYRVHDCQNCL
jgi:hypothetical protein